MIIETERLILRKHAINDAKDFFDLNNDVEVIKYTGDVAFKNIEEAELVIESILEHYRTYKYGRWAVVEKKSGSYFGLCGLKYHSSSGITELGFRFYRKNWGRGFATEAAKACIEFARNHKIAVLTGRAEKENSASIKVLEKCGFKFDHEEILHGKTSLIYILILTD
jgi:ribosomal-protein-alanine N-acetyltransferase